jgi:hypothetical protein
MLTSVAKLGKEIRNAESEGAAVQGIQSLKKGLGYRG